MIRPIRQPSQRGLPAFGAIALFAAALAACGTTAEGRQLAFEQDARTCSSFGSEYGSRGYSDCMLEQQRRRDTAQLQELEKTRLTSEIARDARVMAERARRDRCARDPDRRECRR